MVNSPGRFLMVGFGSDGDIIPLVTLGTFLRERRHSVTLVAPNCYADLAAQNQLGFISLSSREDYVRSTRDQHLVASR